VELLGSTKPVVFSQTADGLTVTIPEAKSKLGYALVFKVS